jgi:uncharacterized protein with HEPN domain
LPFRDDQAHLRDIVECIELIDAFIREMNLDAYEVDIKTKSAVERQIQILTEAAKRLGKESGPKYLGTDWQLLRHGKYHSARLSSRERRDCLEHS